MGTRNTGLATRHAQNALGNPRCLRIEPLEDRRLLSANRAAEAINQFAYDVYEHMQNSEGNLFYSPLSVATALAMTYAGAAGQTAAEMEEVLHLGSEPGIHSSFADLLSVFATQSNTIPNFDLEVANAIWPAMGLPIFSNFIDTIETDYSGHIQNLDYANNPALAADIINDWIEEQTHDKIQDMVQNLTPDMAMVLTNAVYFKGLWDQPFDPRYTRDGEFTLASGEVINTPMMFTPVWASWHGIDGFSMVELPFAGGAASMVIVLPRSTNLTNDLTAEAFSQIDAWLESSKDYDQFQLWLPKFKTTVDTDLKQLLIGMGMPAAFGGGADFSAMTDAGVFIGKVYHKATIEVNEQGTEAAAATVVELPLCFAAGTPVMTPDGEKRIEELEAGDYVLARDEHNLEGPIEPRMVERLLHGEANIVEIHVGGQVIRTTAPHPFFVRGRGWTAAADIKVEDRLSTSHGDWIEVEKVLTTEAAEPVYNLRVAEYRTYFIGSRAWKFGIWTHNYYESGFRVNRPFHMIIRDNVTSTITFMGRIDDPTLLNNAVKPNATIVTPATGDFDGDGDVDGRDFLAWQRGYGTTTGAAQSDGDSNADGDVDAGDLATWQDSYGQTTNSPLATVMADEVPAEVDNQPNFGLMFSFNIDEGIPSASEAPLGAGSAVEPVVVDRAFDHWLPPRRAVQDFGDIATCRELEEEDAELLNTF